MFARFRRFGRLQHQRKDDVRCIEYTPLNAGLSEDMLEIAQSSLVALNVKKNQISKAQMADMLRLVGQNPTTTDLEDKLLTLNISSKEYFTFGEFVHLWFVNFMYSGCGETWTSASSLITKDFWANIQQGNIY